MHRLFVISLLAACSVVAHAQADTPFMLTKAEMQQHKAALLTKAATDPHGVSSETLHRDAGHSVSLGVRVRTGEAEQHMDWADEMVVLEGNVVVVIGGTINDTYEQTTKGEFRGSGITGGKEYPLHPGDMLYVPAGLPHLVKLVGTEPLFMTGYKVK
jgi:mannose-6-phosphate isomerase-like protein (cupin superfamily)